MSGAGAITHIVGFLTLLFLVSKPTQVLTCQLGIDCTIVLPRVSPCLDFILDKTDQPAANCCIGIKQLDELVKCKPDRQQACECIKQSLSKFPYDSSRLLQLPKKCGTSIVIPPDLDCSKIG